MLLLCAHSPAWLHPKCSSHELICLLLYLRGIPRFGGEGWGTGLELEDVRTWESDTKLKHIPLGLKSRPWDLPY